MEKRIQEIIDRCKTIDGEQAAIERQCELENNGQFTDEQRESYSTLKTEYDTLIAEKNQLEADAAMRAARAGRATDLQPKVIERKSPPNSGSPHPKPVETDESDDDRRRSFKIPANVKRHRNPRNFTGEHNGLSAEERAYRFGQYCLAKLSHDIPSRYKFRDALNFVQNYMGGIENVAHGENDGTTGGNYLVPEEFSADLILLRESYGVARRLLGRVSMGSDIKHIPARASGLTAYFVNESDQITESNMTWSDVMLSAKDLGAIARMSNQLSADAVIDVGDSLAGEIAYAFAEKEDQCAFNGDGTSTYGGIRGARAALQTAAGSPTTTSAGGVVVGAGNLYSELVLTDFEAVVGTLPQYADTPNAAWVCHRVFYYTVMKKLELAAGGATATETSTGLRRARPLFLGYPVEFSQVMPSTTANSQLACLLGDFTLGAKFGDRQQESIMFSEHAYVNSESVFERNQIAVRGTERFDIVVHGVGNTTTAGPIVGLQMLNS